MMRAALGASASRPHADRPQEGSAVVSALAVGLIVTTAVMLLTARSVGETMRTAAAVDRAQASSYADLGVAIAVAQLDAGLAQRFRAEPAGAPSEVVIPVADPTALSVAGTSVVPGADAAATMDVRVASDAVTSDLHVVSVSDVGGRVRTSTARVRLWTTIDHLLHTRFEVIDPALSRRSRVECAVPQGDAARSAECQTVLLPGGQLDGPVHSEDALGIGSATSVTSVLSTAHVAVAAGVARPGPAPGSVAEVVSAAPFGLHHHHSSPLPADIASLAAAVDVTCRFRGPTLIRFDGLSVRVKSPRSVVRAEDEDDGEHAVGCLGVDRNLLVAPTTIVLPARAVIEVVADTHTDCARHPLGLETGEDAEREWWCNGGDAFVWGAYRGARTVMAHDNIQIVHDVTREVSGPDGRDVLGLVAGDSVILRRPVGRPVRRVAPFGTNIAFVGESIPPFGDHPLDAPAVTATTWEDAMVTAGLVALRGSIGIQNPFGGQVHGGPLRIEGSLASRFRGLYRWEHRTATGALSGETGYQLELRYDKRLLDIAPPGMPVTAGGAVRFLALEPAR